MLAWACIARADETATDPRIRVAVEPLAITEFALTNQDNKAFKFRDLRGQNALVFFGFTHCPSICPAAIFKLKLLSDSVEKAGQTPPAVVLISVDGERDTPEVMKTYLAGYSESFVGLTGEPKAVRKIAAEFKAVFFKGLPSDNSGNYQVEHTSLVYLVDAQGRLRATFLDASVESMATTTRRFSTQGP
jgi:protein SCO1